MASVVSSSKTSKLHGQRRDSVIRVFVFRKSIATYAWLVEFPEIRDWGGNFAGKSEKFAVAQRSKEFIIATISTLGTVPNIQTPHVKGAETFSLGIRKDKSTATPLIIPIIRHFNNSHIHDHCHTHPRPLKSSIESTSSATILRLLHLCQSVHPGRLCSKNYPSFHPPVFCVFCFLLYLRCPTLDWNAIPAFWTKINRRGKERSESQNDKGW
jgi:hypothetical protein